MSAPNLRRIFDLTRAGLRRVFVTPVRENGPAFLNAPEELSGNRVAREILTTAEARFANAQAALLSGVGNVLEATPEQQYLCMTLKGGSASPRGAMHSAAILTFTVDGAQTIANIDGRTWSRTQFRLRRT